MHADKINVPVLLMHGDEDLRVPISHGKKMRDALERYKKPVTWISFLEEGHGLTSIPSPTRYYTKLRDFLGQHIGLAPGKRRKHRRHAAFGSFGGLHDACFASDNCVHATPSFPLTRSSS
ncbi:S9 family peptidase [Massilia sp. ST3]|uniref:alpha/beta hydrolase family protein n=1 Tax=Massilia sp. ST3 TaxID=2824903 RepID=UPI0027D99E80|nr:prolyl oligopeptidase family serine peptidase [Massilia sp. ST3]